MWLEIKKKVIFQFRFELKADWFKYVVNWPGKLDNLVFTVFLFLNCRMLVISRMIILKIIYNYNHNFISNYTIYVAEIHLLHLSRKLKFLLKGDVDLMCCTSDVTYINKNKS